MTTLVVPRVTAYTGLAVAALLATGCSDRASPIAPDLSSSPSGDTLVFESALGDPDLLFATPTGNVGLLLDCREQQSLTLDDVREIFASPSGKLQRSVLIFHDLTTATCDIVSDAGFSAWDLLSGLLE